MSYVYRDKRSLTWRQRLLVGVLLLVTAGLGLADWAALTSFAVHPLMVAYASSFAWHLWDTVSVILLILGWLVLVYLCAHFYQKALMRGRLWRLFGTVTAVQIALPLIIIALVRLLLLVA